MAWHLFLDVLNLKALLNISKQRYQVSSLEFGGDVGA